MKTSTDIGELATALAKAQSEIGTVTTDARNPHFGNTYATLAAVREACIPQCNKHGIAVVQSPSTLEGGAIAVTTRLQHTSGQWMESVVSTKPNKPGAQDAGSVITYLRRYALAAMLGLAQDDDDGEADHDRSRDRQAASNNNRKQSSSNRSTKKASLTEDGALKLLAKATTVKALEGLLERLGTLPTQAAKKRVAKVYNARHEKLTKREASAAADVQGAA